MSNPLFGPGGNSKSFAEAGNKHSYQAPAWLKNMGLDAYEYEAGNGVRGSEEAFRKIGLEAKLNGIKLSFHAPYFISLSGTDPETRLKSVGYIKQSVDAAELMGAYIIVVHAGSAGKISRSEAMELAKDTLWKTLEATEGTPVRIGIETMGKKNQLGTLEEVIELCGIDERLYPVVDFGHLNARDQGGVFVTSDDYKRVFDLIGSRLSDEKANGLHCHFSKIEYTAGGEKRHLTFEDEIYGPEFAPLAKVLAEEKLSPVIICESAGTMAEDALEMKREYRSALLNL